jgi:hypothetical protein
MYIADGIKDWGEQPEEAHNITIHVANTSSADVAEYLVELGKKGWTVATNHTSAAAASISNGMPNGIYAIAHPVNNPERATHITADGSYVRLETATSVVGPHQHLWSIYPSVDDAIIDMELRTI